MPGFLRAELIARAKAHRREPTRSEALLWEALRGRQAGVKFRRQHPIGTYIVDFYSPERGLVVEVDGGFHEGREAEDRVRDRVLASYGITTMRVSAEAVERDVRAVVEHIVRNLPSPPSVGRGRGWGGL